MIPIFVALRGNIAALNGPVTFPSPSVPTGSSPLPPVPALSGGMLSHTGGVDLGYVPAALQMPGPQRLDQAASQMWVRGISEVLNRVLTGKMNVTVDLVLTPNSTSTTIIDARLSATTVITFCPLTANAAAELAAGTLYVASRQSGMMVIAHAANAQDDRIFDTTIIG